MLSYNLEGETVINNIESLLLKKCTEVRIIKSTNIS